MGKYKSRVYTDRPEYKALRMAESKCYEGQIKFEEVLRDD